MRRLAVLVLAVMVAGCGGASSAGPPKKADDPNIRIKDSVGGGIGPVGGSRSREYEGPASQAPDWARPKPGGK
jgi:hypothetical protein